jgi:hypothetical protein
MDEPMSSPEKQEERRRWLEDIAAHQQIMDDGVLALETLDFTNLSDVIGWIEKIRGSTAHVGVKVPVQQIVVAFNAKGYFGARAVSSTDLENNEELYARHLVGNVLNYLTRDGSVHQVVDSFAEQWRKKFNRPAR